MDNTRPQTRVTEEHLQKTPGVRSADSRFQYTCRKTKAATEDKANVWFVRWEQTGVSQVWHY